jgi:hypothetical protein
VQLLYPSRTSIFYRWIKENHLVLYPNLVNDGFYSHVALGDLERWVSTSFANNSISYPLLFPAFASPSLVGDVPQRYWISARITIIYPIKLRTPDLNDIAQPLKQDPFYSLVEVSHPVFKISVALQIQAINLLMFST